MRSFVDAFLYLPALILYSKMVPHHIEGMMIGFIWSIIKLNADVFGRLITVGLNLKFMVMGPVHGAVVTPVNGVVEMPYANLYKMYLIQAGMVVFPIFFLWIVTKRARVEEVQIVLHLREHHSKQHPGEQIVPLSQ